MNTNQYFANNFDCWTQVDSGNGTLEDEMAISQSKFTELVWRMIPNNDQMEGEIKRHLSDIVFRDQPIRSEKERSIARKHFKEGFKAAIKLLSSNCS